MGVKTWTEADVRPGVWIFIPGIGTREITKAPGGWILCGKDHGSDTTRWKSRLFSTSDFVAFLNRGVASPADPL